MFRVRLEAGNNDALSIIFSNYIKTKIIKYMKPSSETSCENKMSDYFERFR